MSFKQYLRKFRKKPEISIKRINVDYNNNDYDFDQLKIINLLNYSKKSGSTYSGELYNSGYHTLEVGSKVLKGQRNPSERLKNVPYNFEGKSVLDLGSNQGGMLHSISTKISKGVGIDYDSRMVNVANRIKSYSHNYNLNFYVFNLESENLNYIFDYIESNKVDICFLLSVCMWLKNWKEVISFCNKISDNLLFETNGSELQQNNQIKYLNEVYKSVILINETSEDDPLQKLRKLLFCNNH